MKTLEDYKEALVNQPSPYIRDRLIAEAEIDGFTAWEIAELAAAGAVVWA